MATPDNNRLLITSAVLTGLTPLIPLPLVDDAAYTRLMRRMTSQLATAHGVELSNEQIRVLSDAPGGGCLPGCLGSVLLYPLGKLFRKLFFFLEWKRAVDIVSHTYYHGYLLNAALREGYLETHGAMAVRAATDRVLRRVDTRLIERAVRSVFRKSQRVLRNTARLWQSAGAPDADSAEEQKAQQVGGIVGQLQQAFARLPAEHFERLETELRQELSDL
jgi:hypothetical protein